MGQDLRGMAGDLGPDFPRRLPESKDAIRKEKILRKILGLRAALGPSSLAPFKETV